MMSAENESLVIDLGWISHQIRQKGRWIVGLTLIAMLLATTYAYLCYEESYRSDATILFSPTQIPTVVSEVGTASSLLKVDDGRGQSNPFKNQEQLLKSKILAKRVIQDLRHNGIQLNEKPENLVGTTLDAAHLRETDFIRLSGHASEPHLAQKVAKAYLKNYQILIRELSYKPLLDKKALFESQIHKTEDELGILKAQIESYQSNYGIVDIATENQLKVTQYEKTRAEIKNTETELSEAQAEINSILKQLKMKPEDVSIAIQSVARGQDSILTGLYSQLNDAIKTYDEKSLVYAPTNPDMQRLQNQIKTLERQIDQHQFMTVGEKIDPKSVLVKDGLRLDMINRLVKRQSKQNALSQRLATLNGQYTSLTEEIKALPKSQLTYAQLRFALDSQEKLLNRLQERLSEIKINLAGVEKNLIVIDPPSLPDKPTSLNKIQLIVGAGLAMFLLSVIGLTVSVLIRSNKLPVETLENCFNAPVLSIIPSALKRLQQSGKKAVKGSLKSFQSKPSLKATALMKDVVEAYQNLAVNLKAQGDRAQFNTLTLSSVTADEEQAVILSNLGLCLAQGGEKTILIDANLRHPELHDVFDHKLDYDKGVVEMINNVSEYLYCQGHSEADVSSNLMPIVEKGLIASGVHRDLMYLNAGHALENPFEFLSSKGFQQLIQALKMSFDWVLVNAPPLTQNPDLSAVLRSTDGLILLTEGSLSESTANDIQQKVAKLNSSVVGVVLQDRSV